jgi:hypothetical protein
MPPRRSRLARLPGTEGGVPEIDLALPRLDPLFGGLGLSFKETPLVRGAFRFDMVGDGARTAAVGNREYTILPMPENVRTHARYWIAVCFVYRADLGALVFESVSVVVFQGTLASAPKTPVLRAEWDSLGNGTDQHAQPHWHVYPAAAFVPVVWRVEHTTTDGDFESLEEPLDELAPSGIPSAAEDEGLPRMHLAMAAQWHLNAGHAPSEKPAPEMIASWLVGCIRYTHDQLQYIAERVAPARNEA